MSNYFNFAVRFSGPATIFVAVWRIQSLHLLIHLRGHPLRAVPFLCFATFASTPPRLRFRDFILVATSVALICPYLLPRPSPLRLDPALLIPPPVPTLVTLFCSCVLPPLSPPRPDFHHCYTTLYPFLPHCLVRVICHLLFRFAPIVVIFTHARGSSRHAVLLLSFAASVSAPLCSHATWIVLSRLPTPCDRFKFKVRLPTPVPILAALSCPRLFQTLSSPPPATLSTTYPVAILATLSHCCRFRPFSLLCSDCRFSS